MKYQAFLFYPYSDILIAILSHIGFDSFQEEDEELIGYVEYQRLTEEELSYIDGFCSANNIQWNEQEVEDKNWNEIWEASFEPVYVDDFCLIKASFHQVEQKVHHVINIDPKMAFGTGHHHTTYMMIQLMSALDFEDKYVLDYGSGTGVLAILAEFMGAKHIDALDIEQNAFENIQENCEENNCHNITPVLGTIKDIRDKYDIVLANINRNVLLETALLIKERLKENGDLILSGIISSDLDKVSEKYQQIGFIIQKVIKKSNWLALHLTLNL